VAHGSQPNVRYLRSDGVPLCPDAIVELNGKNRLRAAATHRDDAELRFDIRVGSDSLTSTLILFHDIGAKTLAPRQAVTKFPMHPSSPKYIHAIRSMTPRMSHPLADDVFMRRSQRKLLKIPRRSLGNVSMIANWKVTFKNWSHVIHLGSTCQFRSAKVAAGFQKPPFSPFSYSSCSRIVPL